MTDDQCNNYFFTLKKDSVADINLAKFQQIQFRSKFLQVKIEINLVAFVLVEKNHLFEL